MKNLCTSAGRLYSAAVEGAQPTVKDTMVAAHVYLISLEEQFGSAHQMLACFRAWTAGVLERPGDVSDEQFDRSKRWRDAHDRADKVARRMLSEPNTQTFSLRLTSATHTRD
jgi:hypothetical protein